MSNLTDVTAADLRRLLRAAEERETEAAKATPHSVLVDDLSDDRIVPRHLRDTFVRIFDAFALLGVDLLAEDGPALVGKTTDDKGAKTPANKSGA
jgi:hypothetical protein